LLHKSRNKKKDAIFPAASDGSSQGAGAQAQYFLAVEVGGEERRVLRVRDDLGLDGLGLRRRHLGGAGVLGGVRRLLLLRRRRAGAARGDGGGVVVQERERRAVVRGGRRRQRQLQERGRRHRRLGVGAPAAAPTTSSGPEIPKALIHGRKGTTHRRPAGVDGMEWNPSEGPQK